MMRFITKLPKVQCFLRGATNVIRFDEGASRATVAADQSFQSPGQHSFEVFMKDKRVKTAVGFLSEGQTTEYMRDDPIPEKHVSFGGAGWIHPKEIAAQSKYSEGDKIKVEVDFAKQMIRFYVNGKFAGEDEWTCERAYPAVSCNGGPCELEVNF